LKKAITFSFLLVAMLTTFAFAQTDEGGAPSTAGATRFTLVGHTSISAVIDSGQNNFRDANFSAIFLGQLSSKLFFESELDVETGSGTTVLSLEHACIVWMLSRNIAFHAGRFVPHFGLYRGRLGEGFINRFVTDPVGFSDAGIGTMSAVGFGLQGGFPLGDSKMNYDLWVSNGPQLLVDSAHAGQFNYGPYTDNNKNKSTGVRIGFLPFSNSCLEVGVSYENTGKTGAQYSLQQNVGVQMMALDANFYHTISRLKSTLRITAEYKTQDADKFNYSTVGDNLAVPDFDNSSNAYYASASIRPAGTDNSFLRNLELAYRYSKFTTPKDAPWGRDPVACTDIALDYWLKWNCVVKVAYQMQDFTPNRIFVQMYYGF